MKSIEILWNPHGELEQESAQRASSLKFKLFMKLLMKLYLAGKWLLFYRRGSRGISRFKRKTVDSVTALKRAIHQRLHKQGRMDSVIIER